MVSSQEYHLQAAINAAALGNVKSAHIPTPETIQSSLPYDRLYKPTYSQPSTYIRFSSTVEDCAGCPYNLVEEDEVALKILNQKRGTSPRCTETQFEEVMHFFEETAKSKQPYSAVDNPPVVSYAEMEECFNGDLHPKARIFAKDIYEHWKARRTKSGNRPLAPALKVRNLVPLAIPWTSRKLTYPKFETGRDTDDGDPYVCFRRREVRQVRKTRGRDAQSAEKLRRLRKELEDARQLVAMVRQREMSRKDLLAYEKQIFVQRMEVKEMKRKLSIKDDDEDLINQKVRKARETLELLQALNEIPAKEKTRRTAEPTASDRSITPDPRKSNWPAWRRSNAAGGLPDGQGERDLEGHQGQHRQACKVERRIHRYDSSTTYPNVSPHSRRRVPTCNNARISPNTPGIGIIRTGKIWRFIGQSNLAAAVVRSIAPCAIF